jgi:hypothetical protein
VLKIGNSPAVNKKNSIKRRRMWCPTKEGKGNKFITLSNLIDEI